jgi:multiple sugar transport system ATP-binding protein
MHLYQKPDNKFVAGFIGSPTMNFISGILKRDANYFYMEPSPGIKITVNPQFSETLKNRIGNEIEIGIRPENVSISEQKNQNEFGNSLKVIAYENMGSEQLVYFAMNDKTIIAKTQLMGSMEPGYEFFVTFPESKQHLIDLSTGAIL